MKPLDLKQFRKSTTGISGVSTGFHDPVHWINTGNYTLNKLISGDFHKGVPLGKVTMFAGESGSGKSFICSGNLARNAQEQGCFVVLIDSENALDEDWLHALGVDTSPDKLEKFSTGMIDAVAGIMHKFMAQYAKDYAEVEPEKRNEECPKVLFVVDSLGMLMTETEVSQNEKGELKGDMGRKPRALNMLIRNTINNIAPWPVGVVLTNHVYVNQSVDPKYNPDPIISGGKGVEFASSILCIIKKLKLKAEDAAEESRGGKTGKEIVGIRAGAKVLKSRYSKPFETTEMQIPYETGMDPYSGLFSFMEAKGFVKKDGTRYKYIDADGNEVKKYRKHYDEKDWLYLMATYDDAKALAGTVKIDGELHADADGELLADADASDAGNDAGADASGTSDADSQSESARSRGATDAEAPVAKAAKSK